MRGLADLAELVWPTTCGGCHRPGTRWCAQCDALVTGPAVSTAPTPCPPDFPPAWRVAVYDGPVRDAVVQWKDRGRADLTRPLARALARSMRAALAGQPAGADVGPPAAAVVLVVPMPSRAGARRQRGADPLRDLAARACQELAREGRDLRVAPVLEHRRRVADQAGLGAAERATNLADALGVRPSWRHRVAGVQCLLVDDVVTTGSTVAAGAVALTRAGAHPFGVAVVAATQRGRGTRRPPN